MWCASGSTLLGCEEAACKGLRTKVGLSGFPSLPLRWYDKSHTDLAERGLRVPFE